MAIKVMATEQHFQEVLLTTLYKVVLNFQSVVKTWHVTIHIKANEQYFQMVLFILLYRVCKFMDKTLAFKVSVINVLVYNCRGRVMNW